MQINFKELLVELKFGEHQEVDVAQIFGNAIHTMTNDIGLDDFAREVYYSTGSVHVPNEYVCPLVEIIKSKKCLLVASVKRALIDVLTKS